ncbi:MAG: hypothetical protein HOM38_09170, partial [Euryarchaeota archaeon]|nr:hypothetical protein [Euryarchaeota archaeon]
PKIRLEPTTQNNTSIIELGVLNGGTNAYARIDAINLSNYDSNLRFYTNPVSSTTQTLALTLDSSQNATFTGKATSLATAATDGSTTLTTKSYVDGLVTGVPVYKGTWDARTQAEGGLAGDGGNINLRLAANKVLGNYYIVETAGSATPNGANTEPSSWNVGDWCIFSDVTSGAGTDLWQRIDNSSVISGAGTGQKVTKWEGATNAVSETLTDGPITFSTSNNDSTFAGSIYANTIYSSTNSSYYIDVVATGLGLNMAGSATFAGNITVSGTSSSFNTGNSGTFVTNDASNYPRFTMNNASGQLGLFRSGSNAGGMYIGAAGDGFRLYTSSFVQKLLVDQSGNATFAGDINLAAGKKLQYSANSFMTPENNVTGAEISTAGDFRIKTGSSPTLALTIGGGQEATFAGEISSGDDINVNNGKLVVNDTSAEVRIKSSSDTGESYINFSDPSDINPGQIYYGHSNNTMSFRTNDIGQMNISNNLIVFPSTGVHEIRGDRGSGAFAIGNMGDASSQMMVSSRGFLTFNVSNTGSALNATERMRISSTGTIKFNAYGAGTLVTDASGNITASSGGGAGGPYLPLSAGPSYPLTGDLYQTMGAIGVAQTDQDYIAKIYELNSDGFLSLYTGQPTPLEKVRISSYGDSFFVPANNGKIGIGTTSPLAILHSIKTDAGQAMFSGYSDTGANTASGKMVLGNNASYQGVLQYAADG